MHNYNMLVLKKQYLHSTVLSRYGHICKYCVACGMAAGPVLLLARGGHGRGRINTRVHVYRYCTQVQKPGLECTSVHVHVHEHVNEHVYSQYVSKSNTWSTCESNAQYYVLVDM